MEPRRPPLSHWVTILTFVVGPPAGLVLAIGFAWAYGWFDWPTLAVLAGFFLLTQLGVTVGYHRLLTHRSFETYRWVRLIWATLGAMASQGSPLGWVAAHRQHHRFSDHEGDPHSPLLGKGGWRQAAKSFFHAHMGWLFTHYHFSKHWRKYVPDLLKDRWLVRFSGAYFGWVALGLVAPAILGGLITWSWTGALLGFLWGGLVRIFLVQHITFSINSICHLFGSRDYDSGDGSRNNLIFGLLAMGEGWHNNHHAFPTSARHGLKWTQPDPSWWVIRLMSALGLAWNVRLPSPRALEMKALPHRRRRAA